MAVKLRVDYLFFEGRALTKHKSAQILMACATRQDDLTVPFDFEGCGCVNQPLTKGNTNLERQLPVLLMISDDI